MYNMFNVKTANTVLSMSRQEADNFSMFSVYVTFPTSLCLVKI